MRPAQHASMGERVDMSNACWQARGVGVGGGGLPFAGGKLRCRLSEEDKKLQQTGQEAQLLAHNAGRSGQARSCRGYCQQRPGACKRSRDIRPRRDLLWRALGVCSCSTSLQAKGKEEQGSVVGPVTATIPRSTSEMRTHFLGRFGPGAALHTLQPRLACLPLATPRFGNSHVRCSGRGMCNQRQPRELCSSFITFHQHREGVNPPVLPARCPSAIASEVDLFR